MSRGEGGDEGRWVLRRKGDKRVMRLYRKKRVEVEGGKASWKGRLPFGAGTGLIDQLGKTSVHSPSNQIR
jgi:hypothetical protein